MSDVVARMKLESQDFDNKLKSATANLQHMEREVRRTGASFEYADKEELEFLQSLGRMETKALDAKGKIKELSNSYKELAMLYARMTDAEKASTPGKTLAGSLEDLKTRIRDGRAELEAIEQSVSQIGGSFDKLAQEIGIPADELQNMIGRSESAKQQFREYNDTIVTLTQAYNGLSEAEKNSESGQKMAAHIDELKGKAAQLKDAIADTNEELKHLASDTSFTDGIGLMTRTVGSCAAAITAWTGDSKEMEAVIKDLAKIGTTVAAVDQLTKAFQKQNLVLLKNPYVAAAAAVVALGVAIGKLIKKSQELSAVDKALQDVQQTGRENSAKEITRIDTLNNILHDNTRSLEERKTALAEIQNLVPDYHGALTEEGNLINDNTGAIDDYIDGLQRAAIAQAAFDKMVELQKKKMEEQVKLQQAQAKLDAAQSMASAAVPTAATGGAGAISMAGATAGVRQGEVRTAQNEVNSIQKIIDEQDAQINALRGLVKSNDIGTTGDKSSKPVGTVKVAAEIELPEGSIAKLQDELKKANEKFNLAGTYEERAAAKKDIEDITAAIDKLLGKTAKPIQVVTGPSGYSQEGISALRSEIQGGMKSMQMGSSEYMVEASRLVDLSTFENLLNTTVQAGVEIDPTLLEKNFEKIDLGVDISDKDWETFVDSINEKLAELELPPIELDVKTGGVKEFQKEVKKTTDHVAGAAQAFSALGNAMGQIDDPGAKVAGMIAEAIGSVAAGYGAATAQAATIGPWAWIAFAVTGLATMISTIEGIKQATAGSYANGGIVPGNNHNDGLIANVSSGELILNRAQQESVAAQLQGGATQTVNVQGLVSGTNLILTIQNQQLQNGVLPKDIIASHR